MTTNNPTAPFIQGRCPMGCGRTLFVANGGHITCSYLKCPRPTAVDELLDDREIEHIVDFRDAEFTVRHPLRERLDDALLECDLHHHIASLDGPPVRPGRYRARQALARWTWEPVSPALAPGRTISPVTAATCGHITAGPYGEDMCDRPDKTAPCSTCPEAPDA